MPKPKQMRMGITLWMQWKLQESSRMITRSGIFRSPGKKQKIRLLEGSGSVLNHVHMRWYSMMELLLLKKYMGDMTLGVFLGIYLFGVISGMAIVVIAILGYLNPGGSIQVNCEEDK